jgi:hypothetical protein
LLLAHGIGRAQLATQCILLGGQLGGRPGMFGLELAKFGGVALQIPVDLPQALGQGANPALDVAELAAQAVALPPGLLELRLQGFDATAKLRQLGGVAFAGGGPAARAE